MNGPGMQKREINRTDACQVREPSRRHRREQDAYESDILKALFIATITPFVLLEISTAGSGFVDALIVSQFLGANDLAVQGLANPYFSVTGVIGGLLVAGMFGIGLATSVGAWLQYLVLLSYARSPKSSIRFSIRDIEWSKFGRMVTMGLPKAIRRGANMLRPLLLNRFVLTLGGSAAMSAMSIRNSLDGMGDVVGSGIAAAVMLVVGILYGEENRVGILQICRLAIKTIFIGVEVVAAVRGSPNFMPRAMWRWPIWRRSQYGAWR